MLDLKFETVISSLQTWLDSNNRLNLGEPQAAVLVPFIEKKGLPYIVLTLRSNKLNKHSGQISFPGGKVDTSDIDIFSTALRETEEEIGIDRRNVNILGLFDDFFTPYYSSVTPVIAKMSRTSYRLSEDEIEEIIEVPVSDLLDPKIYHTEILHRDGRDYEIHFYKWYDENQAKYYDIWGATAGVLHKLLKIIV